MGFFNVSARNYRPTTFESVLGQHHVTTTLKNAIKGGRLAQTFLFCGPKGVGKTSCARILAKTINCEKITDDGEACNSCSFCMNSLSINSFNVFEFDAASNNSVEDIRSLIEQVRYAPQMGSYKVYIIDEVHMLSNSAFNAFLKTLEEPPKYAIFILATTEKSKIIPTIYSRCQIFDFNRIQSVDIVKQMKHIAQQQSILYEEEALYLMAQKADGAMRDALFMFDRVYTYAGKNSITYVDAASCLQVLNCENYFEILDCYLQNNLSRILTIYDIILKNGFDGQYFIIGFSEHLRNLLMCQDEYTLPLLEASDAIRNRFKEQSSSLGIEFLIDALNITSKYDLQYRHSSNKRLHVELMLINLLSIKPKLPKTNSYIHITPLVSKKDDSVKPIAPTVIQPTVETNKTPSITTKIVNISEKKMTTRIPTIDGIKKTLHEKSSQKQNYKDQDFKPLHNLKQDEVMNLWKEYTNNLKLSNKMIEHNVFNQCTLHVEEIKIIVQLPNKMHNDIFIGKKEEVLMFFKSKINNNNLVIDTIVIESSSAKENLYTNKDKFTYLTSKYPLLNTLQQNLMLELED